MSERDRQIDRIAAVLRDRGMVAEKTALEDHIPDEEWERADSLANAVGLYDAGLRLIEGSDPASPEPAVSHEAPTTEQANSGGGTRPEAPEQVWRDDMDRLVTFGGRVAESPVTGEGQ